MKRFFVFGKNNQACKRVLSLTDNPEKFSFYFFTEIQALQIASKYLKPDVLLLHGSDYHFINQENGVIDYPLRIVLIGDAVRIDQSRKDKIIVLPDDCSSEELFNALKGPEQSERELNFSDDISDLIIRHTPVAMFWKDKSFTYVGCDGLFCKDHGLETSQGINGFNDFDLFPEPMALRNRLTDTAVFESGEALYNIEEQIEKPDGSIEYLRKSKIPVKDGKGNVIMIMGMYSKVTDQIVVQEHLKNEKQYLQMLMDSVPDRIYFKNKDSKFIRANNAIARMFGMENPEELYGKTDFDLHDPEHAKQAFEDEQELMRSGNHLINKVESHIQHGSRVWETSTKIPLFDKDNEIIGLVGISRDFTRQKQLEDALAKEKDLLQSLMDNVPDYIYFKDLDSKYIRINKAVAESLHVKDLNEVYGKCDHDFFPKEVADVFLAHEKEIFSSGKPIIGRIEKSCLLDGTQIWISTTKIPTRDENGKITGIVGVSRNVTDEEHTRQKFQHARNKAEEANRSKSLFLANMSHEIRTPMNGVIGMADILKRTKLDPIQEEYLDIIMKSGQTLLTIINDILDFSKIESGKMSLESTPVSIRNIVEEVADIQILQANEKQIDLLTFIDAEIPELVSGDYVRIRQVITNLVNNAIKFTYTGEVYVSAEYKGVQDNSHEILFKVKDSGIGISKENRKKLFKSFSQVDTSTTRRFGGTGLGLAICQKLVRAMGGKMYLKSEEGKGSLFAFTAKFGIVAEPQENGIQFKNVSFKNLNVLVVDDNLTNRKIFREYLETWKMNVYEVSNGADALTELTRLKKSGTPADIVLVDYQMAEMDGIELAAKIKADPFIESIHLILLSSVTDAIRRDDLKKYGFEHYLNKPVKLKQLFNVIASVIGKLKQATSVDDKLGLSKIAYKDKRFLIVEDNEINMKVANFTLKSVSQHVFSAYNGLQAIELFKSEKIDYILMDIQMPVMNGIEATLKIREIERQQGVEVPVKIIAMTANTLREDVERCLKAGMDAFLGKPFKIADLINILREIE